MKTLHDLHASSPGSCVVVAADAVDGFLALECLHLGVMDYLVRPVTVDTVEECIAKIQARRRCLFAGLAPDTACVLGEQKRLRFENDLEKLPSYIDQAVMNARNICPDIDMLKMALSEMLINAVEHGNLNIGLEEKADAVRKGTFDALLKERLKNPDYRNRTVTLQVFMDRDMLEYVIDDEGDGFDYHREFDPILMHISAAGSGFSWQGTSSTRSSTKGAATGCVSSAAEGTRRVGRTNRYP